MSERHATSGGSESVEAARPLSPQVTNSKIFNLEYDVTDLGGANVARVELWVTENAGQSWQPYGTDADLESPFLVEVDAEGTYGYQLLIHSSEGRSTRPPQAGDRPEMSILVDTTKPIAFLKRAGLSARTPGVIEIEWQASDKTLSAESIKLSYAETLNGPWTLIASNVKNTGRYLWQLPEHLPQTVNIQIDVVDDGGNRTVHQLAQPTPTQPSEPRGRIKAIRTDK